MKPMKLYKYIYFQTGKPFVECSSANWGIGCAICELLVALSVLTWLSVFIQKPLRV